MSGGRTFDLGIPGLEPGTRIGEGGNAIVYRAHQTELDRDVAVKVLKEVDEDTRRRFDRERRAMGRLSQHDGIVTVYDSGYTEHGEPYLVMPLLGGSLADEVHAQGTLSWEVAVDTMAQVCDTVGYAHDEGVVHRDLKPANLMRARSGRPLVADFGISRITDASSSFKSTAITLTPAYSPPEALDGAAAAPTADVYSLGATLFTLLVGHPPFMAPDEDTSLLMLVRRIAEAEVPELPATVPPAVADVIRDAMAKEPAARPASASALGERLREARRVALGASEPPTLPPSATTSGRETIVAPRTPQPPQPTPPPQPPVQQPTPTAAPPPQPPVQQPTPAATPPPQPPVQQPTPAATPPPQPPAHHPAPAPAQPTPAQTQPVGAGATAAPGYPAPNHLPGQPAVQQFPAPPDRKGGRLAVIVLLLAGIAAGAFALWTIIGSDDANQADDAPAVDAGDGPQDDADESDGVDPGEGIEPTAPPATPEPAVPTPTVAPPPTPTEVPAVPALDIAGTTVRILGEERGNDFVDPIRVALQAFADENDMTIQYDPLAEGFAELQRIVDAGAPPDIALVIQATGFDALLADDAMVPVPDETLDSLEEHWSDAWLETGRVDGRQLAVPYGADNKSLVWYQPARFAAFDYEPPGTLRELEALVERMLADGNTPFCVGIESGQATGWVYTDWVEDYVMASFGGDTYDGWVAGDVAFGSEEISEAMSWVADLWATPGVVHSAQGSIEETSFQDNTEPLVDGECFMHRQGGFFRLFFDEDTGFADGTTDAVSVFPFPSAGAGAPLNGSVSLATALADRPEVWAVLDYIGSPEFAEARRSAEDGRFTVQLSGVAGVDDDLWDPLDQAMAEAMRTAGVVRFDASDQMPPTVGAGVFWVEATNIVTGQSSVDDAAATIDAAFPN